MNGDANGRIHAFPAAIRRYTDGPGIVSKLKQATAAADEVAVEFGVNISGKSGIILVEGEVAANLKVTITWKSGQNHGQAAGA